MALEALDPVVRHQDAQVVVVEKPPGLTTMRHSDEAAEFGRRAQRFLPRTLADLLPGLLGGGPRYCITPLCIFDFEEETKRMRLKSVHPGVSVEQVLANTGFTPVVPAQVPTTPPPTAAQVALLRNRIDVAGVLRRP